MGKPSKAWPIDPTGRVWITEASAVRAATAQISVGMTAVLVTTGTSGLKRRKLLIRNIKDPEVVVYIGDASVTVSSGFPLFELDELELDVDDSAVVKAIRATSPTAPDGLLSIMEIE